MLGLLSILGFQPQGAERSGPVGVAQDGRTARFSGCMLQGTRRYLIPITPHLVSANCNVQEQTCTSIYVAIPIEQDCTGSVWTDTRGRPGWLSHGTILYWIAQLLHSVAQQRRDRPGGPCLKASSPFQRRMTRCPYGMCRHSTTACCCSCWKDLQTATRHTGW